MKLEDIKLAILQPEVPHYRVSFFRELGKRVKNITVYVYNSLDNSKKQGFCVEQEGYIKYIANKQYKGVLFYNPKSLLQKDVDVLVLMWHFAHFTTWLLLLTKWIHRKKIIIWGQGISVKRYLEEEKRPNLLMKWMLALSDGAWIYMPKERDVWRNKFPKKKVVALSNTIGNVSEILNYKSPLSKELLKKKYGISQSIIYIYCARFNTELRRIDILEDVIKSLDSKKFGFIIIGEGTCKPEFNIYRNVYDFGSVYDDNLKRELFSIADAYFQPAWLGLSVVESMAYAKPVFTFVRSKGIKHGVESFYIINECTGLIFNSMTECIERMNNISLAEIERLGKNAKKKIEKEATINNMVDNSVDLLKKV